MKSLEIKKSSMALKCLFIFFVILNCKTDPLEREILKSYKNEDFLTAAKFCANYSGTKLEKECKISLEKSEEEIQQIISSKQSLPFFKLMLEAEKQKKIEDLLTKNIYLGVKYRSIWREISERF